MSLQRLRRKPPAHLSLETANGGERGRTPRKKARTGREWPCRRTVAGTGREHTSISAEEPSTVPRCVANCSATPDGSVDVLARAVLLVAGMAIPEAARQAVLTRVVGLFEKEAPLPR